jgi:cytochrome b561
MLYHESFGLIAFGMLFPRLYFKLTSKAPAPLAGSSLEQLAGKASHYLMLGIAVALPTLGVTMSIFDAYGLPFFNNTFHPLPESMYSKKIANFSYDNHKRLGTLLEYLIPVHVGGAFFHVFKGQSIFPRILGFLNKPK